MIQQHFIEQHFIKSEEQLKSKKTLYLAKENFNISNRWIEQFKQLHERSFKKIYGESSAIDN